MLALNAAAVGCDINAKCKPPPHPVFLIARAAAAAAAAVELVTFALSPLLCNGRDAYLPPKMPHGTL